MLQNILMVPFHFIPNLDDCFVFERFVSLWGENSHCLSSRLGITETGLFQNWLNLAISDAFIDDSPCDERQTYNLKLHLKVGAIFFFFTTLLTIGYNALYLHYGKLGF